MSVEILSGLERKINFTIHKDAVQVIVKEKLKKHAKTAKMQGFRPGKVPANVVEQMYGQQAFEEALNDNLEKQFIELITAHKLNLVGYPKFDLAKSDKNGFDFSATFEVMPEFELGDLTAIEIENPVCNFTDEHVEKTIEILRKQRVTYEDGIDPVQLGDRVVIDFLGSVDGVEFDGGKGENYPFVVGQKQMLEDFENGVLGLKPNETVTVDVKFPEEYHAENLKGKTAQFVITLKSVSKAVLPALTEEFIKSLGVASGDSVTLHTEIKENLGYEVSRRLATKLRSNVLDSLNSFVSLDVPSVMIHDEIHNMMSSTTEKAKQQGYKPEQINLSHEMFADDAKRLVKLRFIIQKFIKDNAVEVNDDEVKQVVEDMAKMYEDANEYVAWYYQDAERIDQAKAIAMEHKVTGIILTKAKCNDVEVSYEELMQQDAV